MIMQPQRIVFQPALRALDAWLEDQSYSAHCRERIVRHVAHHDELAGAVISGHLDPEDEEVATEIFAESLPAVDRDHPSWDDPSVWLDVETLLECGRPVRIETLPPIAGGSPAAEPYVPSAEDLEDYRAWAEDLDRREEIRQAEARRNPQWGYE